MTETKIAPNTFTIEKWQLALVEKKLEKLNKRAAKIGCEPCSVAVLSETLREVTETAADGSLRKITICEIEIEFQGAAPVVSGYQMIASIQHTDGGNLIRDVAQDGTSLEAYRSDEKPVCEHCSTRRARKDTYIVRHVESGTMKQIGRNCLADYIRSSDVSAYALRIAMYEACSDAEDEYFGGGGFRAVTPTASYLAFACRAVELHGFKPSSFDESTTGDVGFAISPLFGECAQHVVDAWKEAQPTDGSWEKAAAILEWIETVDCDSNDYLTNLRVALRMSCINRTGGLVASAVKAFDRAKGIEEEKRIEKEKTLNEHFGEIKERCEFTLTVVRNHHFETQYGTKAIVNMRDEEGRCIVWFGTSPAAIGAEPGDKLTGKATIKAHEEYKGTAQTVITRARFTEVD